MPKFAEIFLLYLLDRFFNFFLIIHFIYWGNTGIKSSWKVWTFLTRPKNKCSPLFHPLVFLASHFASDFQTKLKALEVFAFIVIHYFRMADYLCFILKFFNLSLSRSIYLRVYLILALILILVFYFFHSDHPIFINLSFLPFFFIFIHFLAG